MKRFYLNTKFLWDDLNKLNLKKGVYILKIHDGNKPKKIGRLLGIDNEGILYIGKCDNFTTRVINLKKSISDEYNNSSHICGRRYKNIPNYYQELPFDNMIIEIIPNEYPNKLEKKVLNNYFNKFGEVPPLNAIQ